MTTWLKLLWWLLAAACLGLWTTCLRMCSQALDGYRRRKLRQQAWETMLAAPDPACESGNRVRFGDGLAKRRPTRGKRTALLVGIWLLLTVICFLNVWVVMTMLLAVGVPAYWLAYRFGLLLGYARVGRAYIRELEAGETRWTTFTRE